MSVDLLIN